MNEDPNNNKEYERKLLEETKQSLESLTMVEKDSLFIFRMMQNLLAKDTNEMSDEESMRAIEECNTLLGRVNISVKLLNKLQEEHTILCKKVNAFYGKELIKPWPKIDWDTLMDDNNDGDQWKK